MYIIILIMYNCASKKIQNSSVVFNGGPGHPKKFLRAPPDINNWARIINDYFQVQVWQYLL